MQTQQQQQQQQQQLSRSFLAASLQRCRWLPVAAVAGGGGGDDDDDGLPAYADLPSVLASWSEEARQHILTVGAVRRDADTKEMIQFVPQLTLRHPGSVTDLQVARIGDAVLAATGSSAGGVCLLAMQLPNAPGATYADLQFVLADDGEAAGSEDGEGEGGQQQQQQQYLQELPQLHDAPVASVDINETRQSLLSVSGDGSICVVPLDALAQLGGDDASFKPAGGWAGYTQGRWLDSHAFATAGVLGGLQLWDTRLGAKPVATSPLGYGHTGCAGLDARLGPARQLLCLDVHPSRPNLAATGASGGSAALWDLRFASAPLALGGSAGAAGDIWEVRFDPGDPLLSGSVAAVPPLLYCTSDGALCSARAAAAAAKGGSGGGSWGGGDGGGGAAMGLSSEVLLKDSSSINSFDIEAAAGQDVVAVTDYECLLLLHRPADA